MVLVVILLCLLWGCKPFSSLGPFSSSFSGDPVLSPVDDCEHPLLYLPGTGDSHVRVLSAKICWHMQ